MSFIFLLGGNVSADSGAEKWTVINSSYADIYVQNDIDLKDVVRKIDVDFAKYDPLERNLFLGRNASRADELACRIDIIVRKVRNVLDMYPKDFKISIRMYNNHEELDVAYREIFEEEADHKAFYIQKFKTIYISLDNLSEAVLAHEIGHAVIDDYFIVLPPSKIRELLACYVDLHLRD